MQDFLEVTYANNTLPLSLLAHTRSHGGACCCMLGAEAGLAAPAGTTIARRARYAGDRQGHGATSDPPQPGWCAGHGGRRGAGHVAADVDAAGRRASHRAQRGGFHALFGDAHPGGGTRGHLRARSGRCRSRRSSRSTIDTFQVPWQGEAHVRAVATDNAGVLDIELALEDQTLAAAEGSELSLDLVPAEIPGIQPGRTYTLTAIATDAAGNTGVASLPLIIGARQVITATAAPTISPAKPSPTPAQRAVATASARPTVRRADPHATGSRQLPRHRRSRSRPIRTKRSCAQPPIRRWAAIPCSRWIARPMRHPTPSRPRSPIPC